ncbi:hypothetical protein SRB17_22790 [Streptomyces sp. RB17]|nr:hypothetical protein [Streptomyces sp. RB17]
MSCPASTVYLPSPPEKDVRSPASVVAGRYAVPVKELSCTSYGTTTTWYVPDALGITVASGSAVPALDATCVPWSS